MTSRLAELARRSGTAIRRELVYVLARIASSARRLSLRLPSVWPSENAWTTLFTGLCESPPVATT
jgi:hypothetical protein